MPQINPALNVLRGARQVVRVMYQMVQVWPPFRAFCDYFERPDGPLGPTWMPGIIRRTGGYDECTTIEPYIVDGHVEGDEDAAPALLATETEIVFYDDFDRPPGPLGPNWIPAAVPMDGGAVRPMPTIEIFRVWDPETDPTIDQARYGFVAALMTGDYTVDLKIDNVVGLNNSIGVLAGFDTNLASGLEFGFVSDGSIANTGHLFVVEWFLGGIVGTESLPTMVKPWFLRIEKQGTTFRLSYAPEEGTPVFVFAVAYDRPGYNGQHVGMRIEHRAEALFTPYIAWLKVTKQVEAVHLLNDVMTVEPYIGDQFVEIITDNVHQGGGVEGPFILYCQANTKNLCCTAVWCEYSGNDLTAFAFQQNALGQVATVVPSNRMLGSGTLPNFALPGDPTSKLRLEVGRNGRLRFLATDDLSTAPVVVLDRMVPALSGDRVGFAFMWRGAGEPCSFTDDFDRADGPIGPNWTVATDNPYYDWVEVPMLVSGNAAIAPENDWDVYAPNDAFGSAQWATPAPGNQFIEVCVTGLDYNGAPYPASQKMTGQIRLFCQGDAVTCEREEMWVEWSTWRAPGGELRREVYYYNADGSYGDTDTWNGDVSPWAPAAADPTVCIRLECDADGAVRVYFDLGTAGATTLVFSGTTASGHTGPYVGFRLMWFRFNDTDGGASPKVLWSKGGCLGATAGVPPGPGTSYHILEVCGGLTEIPGADFAVNVLFCVDTTGSMPGGVQLRHIMRATVDKLTATYGVSELHIGVIDYKDFQGQGGYSDGTLAPFKIYTDLTTAPGAYNAAIDRFDEHTTYGGGDTPEAVFSALHAAVGLNGWASGGTKNVIVIADAEPLDPEPHTGYTHLSTMPVLLDADIRVSILLDDYGPAAVSTVRMKAISDATDGVLMPFDINDEDLVDAMAEAIVAAIDLGR